MTTAFNKNLQLSTLFSDNSIKRNFFFDSFFKRNYRHNKKFYHESYSSYTEPAGYCLQEDLDYIGSEGNLYSYLCYSVFQFNTYIYLHTYPCGDLTVLCSLIFCFCYNFGYLFVCFLFGKKNIEKTPLGCDLDYRICVELYMLA